MNQTENIISKLRSSTGALHTALEDTPLSMSLMDETGSMKNYITYLLKMRDILAFYEKNIFPALTDIIPDLSKREKLNLIDKDLNYLIPERPDTTSGFEPQLSNHPSSAYALGCMYVLEGSTLGGRVILKHIAHSLEILPDTGGAFFAGYGEKTGSLWKGFLQSLNEYAENNISDEEIIEGAKDTFTSIKKYFEI